MTHPITRMGGLIVILALVGAACSGGGGSASSPSAPGPAGTITVGTDRANNHGSAAVSGSSKASVELDETFFAPTVLQGKPGQTLTLELHNSGTALHNISIDAQHIDQDVQRGQNATVTVTFPQSGIVEFYCKYHRAAGMVGELTVG